MNIYADAIDILEAMSGTEVKKLVFKIAANNPGAVVKAHEALNGPTTDNKIIKYAAEGNAKIPCVKFCRQLTGEGLKEAKEHVERLVPF